MELKDIWEAYQHQLKAFLHSRINNPVDVDDVLQEVLLKTHQNLHTIQNSGSIKAWLFQVTHRTVIDYYRRQSKAPQTIAEEPSQDVASPDVMQALSPCVAPFIKGLPEESATLLQAVELEGISQKQLAADMGLSYSTLKSRVQKGRAQLRELFEACCNLSHDATGRVTDYEPKSGCCDNCE